MGVFDYLECDIIPEEPGVDIRGIMLKTQSLVRDFSTFRIFENGQLVWRYCPFADPVGYYSSQKPSPSKEYLWCDMFTGVVNFYACASEVAAERGISSSLSGWIEFDAAFSNGLMTSLSLVKYYIDDGVT